MQCLRGAMRNVEAAAERMDLRKEYIKLFSIASNNSQVTLRGKGLSTLAGLLHCKTAANAVKSLLAGHRGSKDKCPSCKFSDLRPTSCTDLYEYAGSVPRRCPPCNGQIPVSMKAFSTGLHYTSWSYRGITTLQCPLGICSKRSLTGHIVGME